MADDLTPFRQLLVSLLLGLLVGIQREWRQESLAGVRSFTLVTLAGTITAMLAGQFGGILMAAAALAVTALIVMKQRYQSPSDAASPGLSTEFALLVMFGVGALVRTAPAWVAISAAGITAVMLQAKMELHGLARRLTQEDLRSVSQFVLVALVILPVLPDEAYGPYAVLNPHHIWLVVVIIVGIGLAGYVAYRLFGERAGALMSGVLGGLISSTATTLGYARQARDNPGHVHHVAFVIVLAWAIPYARIAVLVGLVTQSLRPIYLPLAALFALTLLFAAMNWRGTKKDIAGMPPQENPSELGTALVFAVLYSVILLGAAWAQNQIGSRGLIAVSALAGLTDLDAIALSVARLVESGRAATAEAWPAMATAIFANVTFRGLVAWSVGGRALFRALALPWIATLVAIVVLALAGA